MHGILLALCSMSLILTYDIYFRPATWLMVVGMCLSKNAGTCSAVRCCIVVNCDQMSKVNSGLLSELMLRMEMYTEGSRSDIRCVRGLTQGSWEGNRNWNKLSESLTVIMHVGNWGGWWWSKWNSSTPKSAGDGESREYEIVLRRENQLDFFVRTMWKIVQAKKKWLTCIVRIDFPADTESSDS